MKNLNPSMANYFQEITISFLAIAIVTIELYGLTVISTGILGA